MAAGGAWVVLVLFALWTSHPLDVARAQHMDEGQVSAPPELLAMVPAAAEAIVAAGYTSGHHEGGNSTPQPPVATVVVSNVPGGGVGGSSSSIPVLPSASASPSVSASASASAMAQETFLIVGDTRYAWQQWSPWHCNCPAGSMSRVRDITYTAPGLRLDPLQYNVLRFEREPCTYAACACDRALGQCLRKRVTCERGATHLCALQDIEYDQLGRKEHFWRVVFGKLKELQAAIRELASGQAKVAHVWGLGPD